MRVWDIKTEKLCRAHLLGQHREIHAIWNILTRRKKGYSKHPETLRWDGKLKALYNVHEKTVEEMVKRGYNHYSPLGKRFVTGQPFQDVFVDSPEKQVEILKLKKCACKV